MVEREHRKSADDRPHDDSEQRQYSGRSAQFRAYIHNEEDVHAIAQRITQYLGGAMQDETIDGVEILLKEIEIVESEEDEQE